MVVDPRVAPDPSANSQEYTPRQKRFTLVACLAGWAFDGLDFMVVALLASKIAGTFDVGTVAFGLLVFLPTKLAAALGAVTLGSIADRFGRKRVLMASILTYSLATGAAAFAPDLWSFVALRIVAGFGIGAEWAVGFALLNEVRGSTRWRGSLGGLNESMFAVGFILAVIAVVLVEPSLGWRGALLVAAAPALLVVPIRLMVPESGMWLRDRDARRAGAATARPSRLAELREVFGPALRPMMLRVMALTVSGMFAVWLMVDWLPWYLEDEGYGIAAEPLLAAMAVLGGITTWGAGALSDKVGRRRAVMAFALLGVAAMAVFATSLWTRGWLLPASILLFGASLGYFGVFGAWFSELMPTRVRATGGAVAYNGGRAIAALAGLIVPTIGLHYGLGAGMALAGLAFVGLALAARSLPETRGQPLEDIRKPPANPVPTVAQAKRGPRNPTVAKAKSSGKPPIARRRKPAT